MATYKYNDFTYSQEEIDEKVNSLDTSLEDYLINHPEIEEVEEEEEVVIDTPEVEKITDFIG